MKTVSLQEAVEMIPAGASLLFGGFMGAGSPQGLIDELVRQQKSGLTIIGNDTAKPGVGVGKLISAKLVRKAIVSHIGLNPETQQQMISGEMEVELAPQGTLIERIRSGGSGLGGVLTPTGVGTLAAEGKQTLEIDGKLFLVERPIRADFALVNAKVAAREKFTTIYSGMDVEPFRSAGEHRERVRAKYGLAQEHVVIGKIARLFHLKGHEDLITAAQKVVRQYPNVRFLLVGDGILRGPLTAKIADLGLSDHFVSTGLVPPSEVPGLIGAMDVLVHTSYREGLARALPQALIAGRPVVSYDVDGAREVTISGETGFLVAPRDIDGLAEAIARLAGDPSGRAEMGREGQRRFTEQFRHQTMTRLVRELYEQILRERAN